MTVKNSKGTVKHIDVSDAPNTVVWAKFASEKWDMEYARNVLLHYISSKGLDKDCFTWVDAHFPEDR